MLKIFDRMRMRQAARRAVTIAVEESSACETKGKHSQKSREKKQKPKRPIQPEPEHLPLKHEEVIPNEGVQVMSIQSLHAHFPHMSIDPSTGDRCIRAPPSSSSSSSFSSLLSILPPPPPRPPSPPPPQQHVTAKEEFYRSDIEARHTQAMALLLPTPQLSLSLEMIGHRATPEQITASLHDRRTELLLVTAQEEAAQLGQAGLHVHTDGQTLVDYPPCARGQLCLGVTEEIRLRPIESRTETEEVAGRAAMDENEDEGKEEKKEEKTTTTTTRTMLIPPSARTIGPPFVLAARLLPHELHKLLTTGIPPDTNNCCILCLRANVSDLVLHRRGNETATKWKPGSLIQYARSLPNQPGGYRDEYMLKKQPGKNDGLVDCMPRYCMRLYYKYLNAEGRWMIDQSAQEYRPPPTDTIGLGESLGSF